MGQDSKIEWCHHTFNPWWGCAKVSPACKSCYAETFAVGRFRLPIWGVEAERRFFGDAHWKEPLRWNRKAAKAGVRERVFCASMADVFEDRPDLVGPRARLFQLIELTPALDWLLLTKRPENMVRLAKYAGWDGEWPANVWAGTTAEDQKRADERVIHLIRVPAAIRFLSCEPLLEPIILQGGNVPSDPNGPWPEKPWHDRMYLRGVTGDARIHLVICGGESGPEARPMDPAWARSLRDQCVGAGTAYFHKQNGEWAPNMNISDRFRQGEFHHDGLFVEGCVCMNGTSETLYRVGKKAAGRELDGRTWDEMTVVTR